MLHQLLPYLFLAVAAFLGGVVNSIAGGGSFLVFPTLIGLGLLPIQANATNTVSLWPGQPASIFGYREDLSKNFRLVIPAIIVAAIGGIAGSWTLLHGSQRSFLRLVPYLFLIGSTSFALSGPISRRIKARAAISGSTGHINLAPLLFLLLCFSFYMGYFGAGAGLLTMSALSLCGVERIAEINAIKTVITTVANLSAVIMFISYRAVTWHYCWFMMITCAIGGYAGARSSRHISDRILRPAIIVLGVGIAVWFFLHPNL